MNPEPNQPLFGYVTMDGPMEVPPGPPSDGRPRTAEQIMATHAPIAPDWLLLECGGCGADHIVGVEDVNWGPFPLWMTEDGRQPEVWDYLLCPLHARHVPCRRCCEPADPPNHRLWFVDGVDVSAPIDWDEATVFDAARAMLSTIRETEWTFPPVGYRP